MSITLFCHDLDNERASKLAAAFNAPINFIENEDLNGDPTGTYLPAIELTKAEDVVSVAYAFSKNGTTFVDFDSEFIALYCESINRSHPELIDKAIAFLC